ncbi:MAG: pirin family protein [Flavobacteriaceae bacterium]|nr:pirin family protein [Flavobacteriaceae bacterium]
MSNRWMSLQTGEVQVMSAGRGIVHSEMNNSVTEDLNLFQIWITPNMINIEPHYNQKKFSALDRKNVLQYLVSNKAKPITNTLTIQQDARISRIDLDQNRSFKYTTQSINHGVYVLLIDGEAKLAGQKLLKRDALGIEQAIDFEIDATKNSALLFIEVPMQ